MPENEAWWNCLECGKKNWISYNEEDLKNKIFACCECGRVHKSFKPRRDKNWLSCIKYTGIGSEVPTGANIEQGTNRKTFGDPDGGTISQTDYAIKYGWDPLVLFCNKSINKNHPACQGFENRCTKKGLDIGELIDEITTGGPGTIKPNQPFTKMK